MFVHLHLHSEYSLLDGAARIKKAVARAVEMGMPAMAITDHGAMHGVVEFYKTCKNAGIRPILGCEVYVAPRTMDDRTPRVDDNLNHLVLLAENEEGYRNLLDLVSQGFTRGFYYKPRVDKETLARHSKGLIALSGCIAGEVAARILDGEMEKARQAAGNYRDIFGPENFFLELQDHGLAEQRQANKELLNIHKSMNIPLVVTNDVHYVRRTDAANQDVLLAIQTGRSVDDPGRMKFQSEELYLKSPAEMSTLFGELPAALQNTLEIAGRCDVEMRFGKYYLPHYAVPEGYNADTYLEELCYQGVQRVYGGMSNEIKDRMKFELGVIKQMGYSAYFLIVWDFIHFARQKGIPVGPGRGSAAGSLVAYSLGITNIDPLKYGLLFERFLNPERVSMPDIDIDFCYERRGEIIDYVVQKYGADRVAQIITFGTMAARAAIRDVGRALSMPYGDVDRVAKLVPAELHMTIEKALSDAPELKELYDQKGEIKKLIDTAAALEGMPRHASTHAAGIVITPEPLTHYLPLYKASDGPVTTQFAMGTVEELGLLKMDMLGLRTLTVISDA
ncbi:MAG: DNA polymerase III subunit alpha, partial [Desulfotomaculaceae bacterium]